MIGLPLLAVANVCELDVFLFWNLNLVNAPSLWQSLQGLCSQFAESGKTSEDSCLEHFPGLRRRHFGAFSLSLPSRALRATLCLYKYFVNNTCVHCHLQTLLMPISYAREHQAKCGKTSEAPCLELYPGSRRRHSDT